jgi:hypothetical protein
MSRLPRTKELHFPLSMAKVRSLWRNYHFALAVINTG